MCVCVKCLKREMNRKAETLKENVLTDELCCVSLRLPEGGKRKGC